MMRNLKLIFLTTILVVLSSFPSIARGLDTENTYQNSTSPNIVFADARVKARCVQNWDRNSDGELSEAEAASVTSIDYVFCYDSIITSFNELRYFTGINSIGQYAFRECTSLKTIEIPNSLTIIGYGAFYGCNELESIVIPNSVTLIDEFAFDDCSSLTSVSIPASVDSIGKCAFYGCDALNDVYCFVIDPSTLAIGSSAFQRNPTNYSSRSLYIPFGSISAYLSSSDWMLYFGQIIEMGGSSSPNIVFADLNVKELCVQRWDRNGDGELSEAEAASVTSLSNVFKDNSSITTFKELSYFTGLNSISSYEFNGCSNLTSVTIPNAVKRINYRAFYNCSKLTSINIPSSIKEIGERAFDYCNNLEKVDITDLVAWCNIDFDNLGNPLIYARHLFLNGQEITDLILPSSVKSIKKYAFQGCFGLTTVTIPNSVKSIEHCAFKACMGLTGISIPNTVDSIGYQAFMGCSSLCQVTIPESVKFIGYSAFSQSENLTEVYSLIPDLSLVTTEWDVFYTLSHDYSNRTLYVPLGSLAVYLASSRWSPYFAHIIEIGGSSSPNITFADARVKALCVQNWDRNGDGELNEAEAAAVSSLNNVFKGNSYITSFNEFRYFTSVASIGESEFSECYMMKNISIPNSVTQIGRMAFYHCSSLESLSIPENVESINEMTFVSCGNMTNVSIPNSVTYIGNQAFAFCSKLSSVIIPNSVTEIDTYAFQRCSDLSRIAIGNSVAKIGFHAFYECDNITEVISKSINPPKLSDSYCFTSPVYCNAKLLVPYNSLEEYKNATYWKDFTYIYGIDDENNILAEGLFLDITNKELEIDESFTITATISPGIVANNTVSWSSSNSNIAVVDNDGKVTAISAGSVIIKASTTDGTSINASCNVTVRKRLVTSISLNKSSTTIYVGDTEQLTAILFPSDASDTTVTWTSSNTNIATVNNDGVITAKSAGSTIITAKTNDGSNLSATCTVTVKNVLATSISLNNTNLTLDIDETAQLVATVYPNNATIKNVSWKSANTSIARVNNYGVVTAVAAGTVNITATTVDGSNLSALCKVTVNPRQASAIVLNETNLSLFVNQSTQLSATVYPSDAANKTVTWKSSNTAVATVNSNGLVTAKTAGTATITATTTDGSNLSASCSVAVSIIPVTSITLSESSLSLNVNYTYQLNATILPSDATYKTVTWETSNAAVAYVSDNGLVNPLSPGEATITARTTDGTNLTASCQVTVKNSVQSITLNEGSLTLMLPETAQLIATIIPTDATNPILNWTSSNSTVAKVDNNGFITSVNVGNTTIKATTTDGTNLSATCQVTVKKQYVTSITLNETYLVMHIGDSFQLVADIQPENASNPGLSWSTGNYSIASVDNNGLVTAKSPGTTYIQAKTRDGSSLTARCTIEVVPDYYITLDTLSHIRGSSVQIVDLPLSLVNKNPISGIQFDLSLPNDVEFNIVDGLPDVWLDDARGTRSHSISVSQLSNGNYRVLVTSATSKDLRGNDGELVHMNMKLPQLHNSGYYSINVYNIIASEADETRHTLSNNSAVVQFYYIVGDADANTVVDIADHASTASYILGRSPSLFFNDAANVDNKSGIDVVDLVGITNIALGIKPITVRQAPLRGVVENHLFCEKLNLNAGGEREITIGIDCGFDFAGFQMDLKLPNGLNLMGAMLGENTAILGIASETMHDGTIRLLGTSFSDAEVEGYCRELITLKVKADNNYIPGSEIEFLNILFAERNLTAHSFDGSNVEFIEPSSIYELMEAARIYIEDGNIIVDTPFEGSVRLIAVDGRMVEHRAHIGHNVYKTNANGIYIIHFNGKTIKVRL